MWFNGKLMVIVVCCLSYGASGGSLRKRDVSSVDTIDKSDKGSSTSVKDQDDNTDWDDSDDDLISGLGLDADSNDDSNNTTKDTGSDYDSSDDLGWDTGSKKKKTDKGSKKKETEKGSTNSTKNKDTDSTSDWLSDLDKVDSSNWPNDQGWNQTSSTNGTKIKDTNSTSGTNTTYGNPNSTSFIDNRLNGTVYNSSQSVPPSSWATNHTSAENVTSEVPHQNISTTEAPSATTTPPPKIEYSAGYWIPIFNFGNDFFFMTNKGYAKLVNFPAPVIYSFMPVSQPANFKPTRGQLRQEEEEFIGNFFENESSFSDCYIDTSMGNLIPYSYFGNWVAVFKLENGWHLQTYTGYVPLDLNGEEAPVTYVFDPVVYKYSTMESFPTEAAQQSGDGAGLADWNEPVVVED